MLYLYLLGCVVFIGLQGFFAASEISFISSSVMRLRHRQSKGDERARRVYQLIMNPEKFLAITLIGTNISLILSSSLLTFFLISLGVKKSNIWITFVLTPVIVIFAELVPKNIGRLFKERFSGRGVGMFGVFEKLLLPLVEIIEVLSKKLVRLFVKKRKHRSPFVTKEEIRLLVKEIEKDGGIDKGEKEAIEEVFEFKSDRVKDVCLRMKEVVAVDYTDSYESILAIIRKHGFTRYPVFRNKTIVGYVNIYDIFYNYPENWQAFIRPITKVGINQKMQDVFTLLQAKKPCKPMNTTHPNKYK